MYIYEADKTLGEGEGILVRRDVANRNIESHLHEFIEIIFVRSGEGIESVGGVRHSVKRGDVVLVNFGREHSFTNSGMEFINVLVRPEFVSEKLINSENIFDIFSLPQFASIEGDCAQSEVVSFNGSELLTVTNLVENMLCEYETKSAGYRSALHGYVQVLFTMLVRKLKERAENTDLSVLKIEKYVEEHLSDKISLSDIAADCFYNPSYFSRKFKSYFGKNLTDYVREKRLLAVARLLSDTDRAAADIATECGFTDKTQFYKLFKAKFGCTPSEYRKR